MCPVEQSCKAVACLREVEDRLCSCLVRVQSGRKSHNKHWGSRAPQWKVECLQLWEQGPEEGMWNSVGGVWWSEESYILGFLENWKQVKIVDVCWEHTRGDQEGDLGRCPQKAVVYRTVIKSNEVLESALFRMAGLRGRAGHRAEEPGDQEDATSTFTCDWHQIYF